MDKSKKMFSEITIIDWYDGPVVAIAKSADTKDLFLCNLVLIDFKKDERIFQIVKI